MSGAEVALILERDGVLIAVEAKTRARVTRADTREIRVFREDHLRLHHGVGVVVAAKEAMLLGDRVITIPYDIG